MGWLRRVAILLVFTVLGPPMGALAFLCLGAVLHDGLRPSDVQDVAGFVFVALIAMLFSWGFGFLPAVVTGVVAATTATLIRHPVAWIAFLIAVGAVCSSGFIVVVQRRADWSAPQDIAISVFIGGASALVCGLLSNLLRPKPARAIA